MAGHRASELPRLADIPSAPTNVRLRRARNKALIM
jgi:hypothetical protein